MKHLFVLLALVGVPEGQRYAVAQAIEQAQQHVPRRDRPTEEVVAAIIFHESRGQAHTCRNEDDGSSSRGLMEINRKGSRCDEDGDRRYAADYDPATNVREGVQRLAMQHAWHLVHCKHPHDALTHYAGSGPAAVRFAKDIRRIARNLRKQEAP